MCVVVKRACMYTCAHAFTVYDWHINDSNYIIIVSFDHVYTKIIVIILTLMCQDISFTSYRKDQCPNGHVFGK